VLVTGFSYNTNYQSHSTAKYAAKDGSLLWEKPFNGAALAVAVDGSDNVVVTGSSYDEASGYDYSTVKYAGVDGALLWEKSYNGPANGHDSPGRHSLALGPDGMVVVTGSSDGNFSPATTYDYATVVYREVLPAISIDRVPAGIRLRFTGIPGRGYAIERAPAVAGPWNTINTQSAPASGLLEYLDANPPAGTAFYRTSEP
jgi:hypothetical protein